MTGMTRAIQCDNSSSGRFREWRRPLGTAMIAAILAAFVLAAALHDRIGPIHHGSGQDITNWKGNSASPK